MLAGTFSLHFDVAVNLGLFWVATFGILVSAHLLGGGSLSSDVLVAEWREAYGLSRIVWRAATGVFWLTYGCGVLLGVVWCLTR